MRGKKLNLTTGPKVTHDYVEQFLTTVVSKLDTCFASPEETIMKQDDEPDFMYYISQGDCTVNIRDENRNENVAARILVEGKHFGEIGIIYGC